MSQCFFNFMSIFNFCNYSVKYLKISLLFLFFLSTFPDPLFFFTAYSFHVFAFCYFFLIILTCSISEYFCLVAAPGYQNHFINNVQVTLIENYYIKIYLSISTWLDLYSYSFRFLFFIVCVIHFSSFLSFSITYHLYRSVFRLNIILQL